MQSYCSRDICKIDRKKMIVYTAVYTLLFIGIAGAIFYPFFKEGKSFVWIPDGLQQHFNSLVYYRGWLREIAHSFFIEQKWEVPLWDMSIGYGSDILTTLHYYVIGDPLNLFCAFVPNVQWMDEFYNGLILLRIYLSGMVFSVYCFSHGKERFPVLLGALMYAFCFWVIVGIKHPYFLNPMVYIPLIFMGVDRILKKRKPGLYMAVLAVSVISNFYFAYMICMFILIYTVFAYVHLFRRVKIKEIFPWIGRFVGYSMTALAIAAVILVPVVAETVSTGRAKANNYIETIYPLNYYLKLIPGFLMGGAGYWSFLGYTAFGILGIFLLFLKKKQNRAFKAAFLLLSFFLLVPFAGHMLNGFSYVINRYMWCYSFLVAYIFVKIYPEIYELTDSQKKSLFTSGIIYLVLCAAIGLYLKKTEIFLAELPMVLLILVLLLANRTWKNGRKRIVIQCSMLGIMAGSLIFQGYYKYAPSGDHYVEEFAKQNEALNALTVDTASNILENVEDDTLFRYDQSQAETWKNAAMQQHLNGTSYYFSLADSNINQFQREMYLIQSRDFCYSNLDGRSILDALASVKYFIIDRSEEALLPYDFSSYQVSKAIGQNVEEKKIYAVFKNKIWLPMGFTSTNYIPRAEYEKLSVTEKQQALLQGVVLEDSSFQSSSLIFQDQKMRYSVKSEEGITLSKHTIEVEKEGASLMLVLDGMEKSETYFILEGLDYSESENAGTVKKEKDKVKIAVSNGKTKKNITYLTSKNNFYSDIHDFLLNTGYSLSGITSIQLTFQEKGTYTFEDMSVVCQPMSNILDQVDKLKEEKMRDVALSANQLQGKITLKEPKILCISLPYSTGWTAYVDGEEKEIKQADTMYMALELDTGEHEILLCYMTPYLKAGLCVSITGILAFVLIILHPWKAGSAVSKRSVFKSREKKDDAG